MEVVDASVEVMDSSIKAIRIGNFHGVFYCFHGSNGSFHGSNGRPDGRSGTFHGSNGSFRVRSNVSFFGKNGSSHGSSGSRLVSAHSPSYFVDRLTGVVALLPRKQLSKVKEVQMDSNPFKSPPPELLAEGLATVMQYLRVRIQRTDAMHGLIRKR